MNERFRHSDGRVHAVAVACTREDSRWLLIRRSATVTAPLKVAFPGGALEPGETQADAVVREMREELGARVRPLEAFWRHDFPDRPLTLWGWRAHLLSASLAPAPAEVHEVLWLTRDEAVDHPDRTAQMRSFFAALLGRAAQQSW